MRKVTGALAASLVLCAVGCGTRPTPPGPERSVLENLPDKTIILGTLDLSDMNVETPEKVAERIRRALPYVPAERIVVAPDCGLKYLPRDVAYGKMRAMVEGADIVRRELSAS